MTTITVAQVTSKIASVITALTPTALPSNNVGFVENPKPNAPLRSWARLEAGKKVVRVFDIETNGRRQDLHIQFPEATLCEQPLLVTVAYATEHKEIYGITTRRGFEDVIAADAQQIRNALWLGSSLVGAGHQANKADIERVDRGNAVVWFLEISVLARFYVAV